MAGKKPKPTPTGPEGKRMSVTMFSRYMGQEIAKEGLRATARRTNLPHTTLAGFVHRPSTVKAETMDAVASKLGFSIIIQQPKG